MYLLNHENRLHPRPQLARERWTDLSGTWQFAYDDTNTGLLGEWQEREDVFDRTICVPFPPESRQSGIGDNSFHPVVWYRRTFYMDPEDVAQRLVLHFGAVDYRSQIWVNGELVCTHEGGQTPFSADITGALRAEGEQVLVVRAEDWPGDLTQPRGKQDWQERPHRIWYGRTTGIWQPVWLEPVSGTHIAEVRWTPDLERGMLDMAIALRREDNDPLRVRVQLSLHGLPVADDVFVVYGPDLQRQVALDLGHMTMDREGVLWFPEHPNLIHANLTVLDEDNVVDEVYSYMGLRSVSVAGGRFLLNERPYYLRMALAQGYWPESHLAAPNDDALRREVELAKELGFNAIRIHQKVEDPRFLYWCDRLGLLVWGEMANAYVFTRSSMERLMREWLEVIARDYSHPCIVAWVPLNESWGVPNLLGDRAQQNFVQSVYHLTKALDPTRPVIANDGWEYLRGDIFGIHDYAFKGETLIARYGTPEAMERTMRDVQPQYRFVILQGARPDGTPIMLTEFGGISYRPERTQEWYGYGTVADPQAFRDKYRELVDAVLDCPTLAGFCYTQLTDTGQETNGLLTDRREPKIDPAIIRDINSRPSAAVPGDVIAQLRKVTGTAFGGAGASTEVPW